MGAAAASPAFCGLNADEGGAYKPIKMALCTADLSDPSQLCSNDAHDVWAPMKLGDPMLMTRDRIDPWASVPEDPASLTKAILVCRMPEKDDDDDEKCTNLRIAESAGGHTIWMDGGDYALVDNMEAAPGSASSDESEEVKVLAEEVLGWGLATPRVKVSTAKEAANCLGPDAQDDGENLVIMTSVLDDMYAV